MLLLHLLLSLSLFFILLVVWMYYVSLSRFSRMERCERELDSEKDAERFAQSLSLFEEPQLMELALEVGFLKTFCSPTIARVLRKSGEMQRRALRRYDDTSLLIREFSEWSIDSERGERGIRRMNAIHAAYPDIQPDDMLFTLAVFVFEPLEWFDRWGYRSTTAKERNGQYHYWRRIGVRMGIKNIPDTIEGLAFWRARFEATRFAYSEDAKVIAEANMAMFLERAPRALRSFGRRCAIALMPERMRTSLGFESQPRWLGALLSAVLIARSVFVRLFMPARSEANPRRRTGQPSAALGGRMPVMFSALPCDYDKLGYTVDELGPAHTTGKLGVLHPETADSIDRTTLRCPFAHSS